jgi:hypothetical protein
VTSSLESSVTLEDVFVVVGAKRVPLAPELAGYLALEIAEGSGESAGEVDPRSVYIGEEGSVAIVLRSRRGGDAGGSDAEVSVRAILARLLDASGSQTVALANAARRRPNAGLRSFVEELEAALIPVNRAAGRRALARLAREVKRVTLGVGRNASLSPAEPPPRRGSSPSYTAARELPARPPQDSSVDRGPPAAPSPPSPPPPVEEEPSRADAPPTPLPPEPAPSPALPDPSELPTVEVRREHIVEVLANHAAAAAPPPSPPSPPVTPTPDPRPAPPRATGAGDEVDNLLASFGVSTRGERAQRNALKALVGLEPTPPPPGSDRPELTPSPASGNAADVESLLAMSSGHSPPAAPARSAAARPPPVVSSRALESPPTAISPALANEPVGASQMGSAPTAISAVSPLSPSSRNAARAAEPSVPEAGGDAVRGSRGVATSPSARRLVEMGSQPDAKPSGGGGALVALAIVVLVAGGAAIAFLRPALFAHDTQPAPPPPVATAPAPAPAPRCHASLTVTDAPQGAEILVRSGQAPVDVERMPVGPRLEFVATAEGFAPKRAVIPAGATWDSGPDGKPRYEVAVQLDRSHARPGAIDPWPPAEPGSDVGGKGAPGTVHLVANPRGAEIWQLAGLGPDTQFDVSCGGPVEVLVAGPTTLRKRLRVAESEFVSPDGGPDRVASVSAR